MTINCTVHQWLDNRTRFANEMQEGLCVWGPGERRRESEVGERGGERGGGEGMEGCVCVWGGGGGYGEVL